MAARVLAVLVAVGMVAGALAYRNRRADGGAGGDGATGQVVCATELGEVCAAFGQPLIEPAATTAERLVTARSPSEAGIAAWVAPGPWPEMVDSARQVQNRDGLFDRSRAIAHTALVAVVKKGLGPTGCTPVTWRCLGDAAQDPSFRLAGDPAAEPSGLFVRAALLGGLLQTTDYATNDLDERPEARQWLGNVNRRLLDSRGFGATSLQQFLVISGSARVYLTTSAAAAGGAPSVDVVAPEPRAWIPAVVATARGADIEIDTRRAGDALVAAGWTAGPVRGDDGLPSPGVLLALRQEVS